MIFQTSSIGFKSGKSPGHSKTDIVLLTIMYFVNMELRQRALSCINTYIFFAALMVIPQM